MLRWQRTPDQVFTAILTAALEINIDLVTDAYGETDNERVAEFSPDAVGLFTHSELLAELHKLLNAHESSKLWMATDYHFLLLYRVLEHQTQSHNDMIHDSPSLMHYGDFIVGQIDFEGLCDAYFWDLDFLLRPAEFDGMPTAAKASLGFTDETFGVVHGMKPHSDELQLKLYEDEPSEPIKSECYRPGLEFPFTEDYSSTELTSGARKVIAVATHWESAIAEAVASLLSPLRDEIEVRDCGQRIVVDRSDIWLNYSINDDQLNAGQIKVQLADNPEKYAAAIRSAASDLLFSSLAEHGLYFRRDA